MIPNDVILFVLRHRNYHYYQYQRNLSLPLEYTYFFFFFVFKRCKRDSQSVRRSRSLDVYVDHLQNCWTDYDYFILLFYSLVELVFFLFSLSSILFSFLILNLCVHHVRFPWCSLKKKCTVDSAMQHDRSRLLWSTVISDERTRSCYSENNNPIDRVSNSWSYREPERTIHEIARRRSWNQNQRDTKFSPPKNAKYHPLPSCARYREIL